MESERKKDKSLLSKSKHTSKDYKKRDKEIPPCLYLILNKWCTTEHTSSCAFVYKEPGQKLTKHWVWFSFSRPRAFSLDGMFGLSMPWTPLEVLLSKLKTGLQRLTKNAWGERGGEYIWFLPLLYLRDHPNRSLSGIDWLRNSHWDQTFLLASSCTW